MNVDAVSPPAGAGAAPAERRAEIVARAAGPGREPADIEYTAAEDATWAEVMAALEPAWERHGAAVAQRGLTRLGLDRSRVPQLREVTERLAPWSGFRFEAVGGLVPKEEFFAGLAAGRFLSTQYVRPASSPLYTPEPDVIHEVIGHGHLLATEELAELHRAAGAAMVRLERPAARQFVAEVFWFSGEFGVVREQGVWKAYGAGLLSSFGELARFATGARIEPIDLARMGTVPYDIDHYQPVLFGARSIEEVLDVVGGFFRTCTDGSVHRLLERAGRGPVTP